MTENLRTLDEAAVKANIQRFQSVFKIRKLLKCKVKVGTWHCASLTNAIVLISPLLRSLLLLKYC